ncbi:hypothetical protein GGI07_001707 [Coemansia sp. Benny D115]|nr:hypothetical protein GGI07_001707 [Coemansia sp. Benny D115]
MAGSPLKGADAFIVQRRPVLRALTYLAVSLMSLINMAMLSSSWSSADFMRRNGSFMGAFNTATSLATMVLAGLFAIATVVEKRSQDSNQSAPKFSQRLTNNTVEKVVSCLMTAWWLAIALSLSNMAFIFRDDIRRCMHPRTPPPGRRTSPNQQARMVDSQAKMATACTVFYGSVVLNWLIWLLWVVRLWRIFTRSNIHFDSSIFREPPGSSSVNMHAMKGNGIAPLPLQQINPATFSPRHPMDPTANISMQSVQYEDAVAQRLANPMYQTAEQSPCSCPDCFKAKIATSAHMHGPSRQSVNANNLAQSRPEAIYVDNNMASVLTSYSQMENHMPNSNYRCCQKQTPVVGTAVLTTETMNAHHQ